MANKSRFDLVVALKANAKDFKSGMNKAQRNLKGFVSQAAPAFGPLNSSAGRFLSTFTMGGQAIRGMIPAIKGVRSALMATGIGAILIGVAGALASVSAYLTKTTEGSDKLNVAWSRLKAGGSVLFDRMIDGGKGLLKMFTDLKGGAEDVLDSFRGVFKEVNQEQKLAAEIAREENQIRKDKIDFIVQEAKLQMEIADLIRKSKLLEYDRGTRVAFLNEAIAKQNQLSDEQVRLAKAELDLQQRRMDMGHNSYDDLEKFAQLQKDVFMIEKSRDDKARELENRIREATNALNEYEKTLRKIEQDQGKMAAKLRKELQTVDIEVEDLTEGLKELDAEMKRVTGKKLEVDTVAYEGLKGVFTDMQNLTALATAGIYGMSSAFNTMATEGKMSMKGMVTAMLSMIEGLIQGYLAQAIAGMIAAESRKGLLGLITGAVGVAGLMALWRAKVPDFAKGGLVYGETLARVGEYKGAATNPEVIAPLSKLRGMMSGKLSGILAADGTQLKAVIESVDKRNEIFG